MAYATAQDLIDRFTLQELKQLAGAAGEEPMRPRRDQSILTLWG